MTQQQHRNERETVRYLRRQALPLNAAGSGNKHAVPISAVAHGTRGSLVGLVDSDGQGLIHLAAEVLGQSLKCGNVLDLQVVLADVAVQHRVVVELLEKRPEDVGDAQAYQEVPLRDQLVQTDRDVVLVPRGRDEMGPGDVTLPCSSCRVLNTNSVNDLT